jgi:hypothetical protein
MTLAMTLNAILVLGVVVMVVSPLAWAIRTARRDLPAGSARARLHAGAPLVRRPRRPAFAQPQAGSVRRGQPWPTS